TCAARVSSTCRLEILLRMSGQKYLRISSAVPASGNGQRSRTLQSGHNRMKIFSLSLLAFTLSVSMDPAHAADRVKTSNGVLESSVPRKDGVRSFKGIPFAQPPVGDLRWREPQPVKNWDGVRMADQFGPRCMQRTAPNSDYWFRSNGMSEDCLYLNVWTPAKSNS